MVVVDLVVVVVVVVVVLVDLPNCAGVVALPGKIVYPERPENQVET